MFGSEKAFVVRVGVRETPVELFAGEERIGADGLSCVVETSL